MNKDANRVSLWMEWSALVPPGMSLLGLAMVLVFALLIRPRPQPDEGAPARIFQLLMTAQLPIAVYFGMKWLPRRRRQALLVLAVQAATWLAAIAAVLIFESR